MTTAPPPGRAIALGELAAEVAAARGDAILVTGPGAISGALYATGPDSPSIYNMELAYATATAIGLALALPERRVISVEGDGSMLAGLGTLATIARYHPGNLTVVVVDNGIFGTGDNSVATQTGIGADLASVAVGLGWPEAAVDRVADRESLGRALANPDPGPRLVVASVDPATYGPSTGRPKPGVDVVESAVLLRRHLERRTARP
ncbi:MAG TPA: thiamine pyrophosphate-dependent enzyme [Candidatus Limnocylindrales bacterium]|nr:thiamine pyrophosphate-dependent enzyme [Candidatus Limnocylindrales bacterium]